MKKLSVELKQKKDQEVVADLQNMGFNMSALVRQLLRDKRDSLIIPVMFSENDK